MPPKHTLDHPIPQEQVNRSLPGERPVVIQIGVAPPDFVARSTTTWGYTDSNDQFVAAGVGVLDYKGGVILGELSSTVDPKEVIVKVSVDYVNPALKDEDRVYNVPVEVNGAHLAVDLTSGMLTNTVLFKLDSGVTTEDFLVFAWNCRGEKIVEQQSGADWFFWPTLIKAKRTVLVRSLAVPRMERIRGIDVHWTLSGVLMGRRLMVNGILPSDRDAMLIHIDSNQDVWVDGVKQNSVNEE
ncbi:MAG: hypothetical protein R3E79_42200 [Caldilineaceae bacterium]